MKRFGTILIVLLACHVARAESLRERLTNAAVIADLQSQVFDAKGDSRGRLLRIDSLIGCVICDSTPIVILRDWEGETLFRRQFNWIPCPVGAALRHERAIPPHVVISEDGGTIAIRDGSQWFVCHAESPREFVIDNSDALMISPNGSFFLCIGNELRVYDFAGRETGIRESCGPCVPRFAGDSLLICANETDSCVIDLTTGMFAAPRTDDVSPWRANCPEVEAIIAPDDPHYVDLYARDGTLISSYEHPRAVFRTALCPATGLLAIYSFGDGQWEQVLLAMRIDALDRPLGAAFSRSEESDGSEYIGLSVAGDLICLRGTSLATADEGEQFMHPNAPERFQRPVPFSHVVSIDTALWKVADTATVAGWFIGGSDCTRRMLYVDSLGAMYIVVLDADAQPRRRRGY